MQSQLALSGYAQEAVPGKRPTTVSLVLGSGGARGLAHIGVIGWLRENGYAISSIAGSSIGALVGGIYAAGKLDAYADWVAALSRLDMLRLLDPTFAGNGLFKGDRIIGVLRDLIGDRVIENLPVTYTAVATDMESREEVWLRNGRLLDAIRASIAAPPIFTPFEYQGRRLLDGCLVNPIPIDPTLGDTSDLTVVVGLGSRCGSRGSARSIRQTRCGKTYRGTRRAANFAAQDVVIEVSRDACGDHEFWRARALMALGRECAARAFAALRTESCAQADARGEVDSELVTS
jgi:predicted acylesterase/phospholipase RssA